jgi:hypothetical protein
LGAVAGRPKRRAARLAAQLAVPPDEPVTDWGAEAMRTMSMDAPEPAVPPATTLRADIARETQQVDRRSLAEWWRDQISAVEQEHQERTELLATAGEHPSPLYAAQARRFAAIGMPPDVLAFMLGISEGILMQHYETECRIGEGMFMAPVFANAFRIATSGNDRVAVKMITEIVNRRGGEPWKPPAQKLEIDDSRGKKQRVIDSSKLTWEQRRQLEAIVLEHSGEQPLEIAPGHGIVPISEVIEADNDAE